MKKYFGDELKNYISQLKRRITEQTGLDKAYERDFVNDIRRYCFGGKSHFVYVVCGLKGTGKTTGLLQAVEDTDDTVYIEAQPGENMTAQEYIELLELVTQKNIIIDNFDLIKDSRILSRYLAALATNGKSIAITGTPLFGLSYFEDSELIQRTDCININSFSYEEFCRVYQKDCSKESFAEFLKTGGLFKSRGVNDFSGMALYIKEAVIDDFAAYYPAEEIKAIVCAVMYLSVSGLNLTKDTCLQLPKDDNYRNALTAFGADSETQIDPVKFEAVVNALEKANFIVKTYNMLNHKEEFRFHLVTPMLAYQTARLVYSESSECEKQAFEAYTVSYMTDCVRETDYIWYIDIGQASGRQEPELVIVNTDDHLAYLFDLKPNETLTEDNGLLSEELEKALGCLEAGGRFITGYFPEDRCAIINRRRVIFAAPDSEALQCYREFNKTYHRLRRMKLRFDMK